ncbi:rRNA N6-adenosine-methyltransferase ZCCHC4-like [Eriocheir sinensis]|uniref:rRNA N6-adenosine-methyltransferase ZCCHC4-like n=1 Tax=Eriocheir sinensis TaxID=95602 RepID=UPI0021C6BABB|nr:rRNA N6-adenosine-methyltransferase ZCCHC4-like [Eriocheir sinensis]
MAARGVVVVEGAEPHNPACVHGPTVLFERFLSDGSTRRFYACAACRDRKDCAFFLWADQTLGRRKRELWAGMCRERQHRLTHHERYQKLSRVRGVAANQRVYCNTCCELLLLAEAGDHESCSLTTPVKDSQLTQPSTLLAPKDNAKLEAQYLFSARSVEVLLSLLGCLGATGVLCVGAPRVHEAITAATTPPMDSLMMDIDDRYCCFFPPERFLQYNMFNHHFFNGSEAQKTYTDFLAKHKKLVLLSDPPFGGRMELLAATLGRIEADWRTAASMGPDSTLPVLFVFPYFLEAQVVASMPALAMMDYQVDYDNHPVYGKGPRGMKHGSAVRVFTNQPLSSLPLPSEDGYRWCGPCRRWVHAANAHCDLCQACTSKDGRTYKHCSECGRCVKPSWTHCQACAACRPQDHSCSPTPTLGCYACGSPDHKHLDCPKRKRSATSTKDSEKKKKKKRKNNNHNYNHNTSTTLPSSLADERVRNLSILSRVMDAT